MSEVGSANRVPCTKMKENVKKITDFPILSLRKYANKFSIMVSNSFPFQKLPKPRFIWLLVMLGSFQSQSSYLFLPCTMEVVNRSPPHSKIANLFVNTVYTWGIMLLFCGESCFYFNLGFYVFQAA